MSNLNAWKTMSLRIHIILFPHKLIVLVPLLFSLVILLASCAPVGNYNPESSMAKGVIKNINISKPVKISNAQPSTEEHLLGFRGIIVNYNKFTQSLVDALKMELKRNELDVNGSTDKELQVAITKIEMSQGAWGFRAFIYAEVKMGDGQVEKFNVTRASYGSPFNVNHFPTKPLDAAFNNLVAEIINNNVIQNYINR